LGSDWGGGGLTGGESATNEITLESGHGGAFPSARVGVLHLVNERSFGGEPKMQREGDQAAVGNRWAEMEK